MTYLFSGILLAAQKTPDEEGRDIVLSMLVVGLIFLGVVALGGLSKMIQHRRKQ
jgi:hypothetical protein